MKKLSQEHIEKIRQANIGLTRTDETKRKMRESKLGTKQSEEHKAKRMESIRQTKLRNKLLVEWCLNNLTEDQISEILNNQERKQLDQ